MNLIYFLLPLLALGSRLRLKDYDKEILQNYNNSSEVTFVTCLEDFPKIMELKAFLASPSPEREALLLGTFQHPTSRSEALEMCMKEIVLFQRFSEEKIKMLRKVHTTPKNFSVLLSRLERLGLTTWKTYVDSKLAYHWGNMMLRWISYVLAHPQDQKAYDTLFTAILESALVNWCRARIGFSQHLDNFPLFSEAEHYFLYAARSVAIDENIFNNTWFKDTMTTGALSTAKLINLLLRADGIYEDYGRNNIRPQRECGWPPEYMALHDRLYSRLTYNYYTIGNQYYSYLTPDAIDEAFVTVLGAADLAVARDIDQEEVDHKLFETSYVFILCNLTKHREKKFDPPKKSYTRNKRSNAKASKKALNGTRQKPGNGNDGRKVTASQSISMQVPAESPQPSSSSGSYDGKMSGSCPDPTSSMSTPMLPIEDENPPETNDGSSPPSIPETVTEEEAETPGEKESEDSSSEYDEEAERLYWEEERQANPVRKKHYQAKRKRERQYPSPSKLEKKIREARGKLGRDNQHGTDELG